MKPIPNSPRAEYERLRARVYAGKPRNRALDDLTLSTPLADARSKPAKGRQELDVWIEVCAQLGLPLPEWTLQQKRQWNGCGWLAVDSNELLSEESAYPNMARLVKDAYGNAFFALFQQEPTLPETDKEVAR